MPGVQIVVGDDLNSGWVQLLPPLAAGQRVLCVDGGTGRSAQSLRYWTESVAACSVVSGESLRLPFADRMFDVVACRLHAARLGRDEEFELLQECSRVLGADGVLYLDVAAPSWPSRPGRRSGALKMLDGLGYRHRRVWSLLFERGVIAEILPGSGYRSCRNSWRAAERIKEWIYGPLAARCAPGHAFVASRSALQPSAIELLNRESATDFVRFIVNPAKSFFQPRPAAGAIAELYVLPGDTRTVERRRVEFAAIARIQAAGLEIRRLLPRICEERQFNGRPVFAIEAFDGVTIDLPVSGLDALFEEAAKVLMAFNRETATRGVLDESLLQRLIATPARAAIARYPAAAEAVASLQVAVETSFRDAPVQLMRIHGDYKLENLVFDALTRRVQAVIDWELAADAGLPLTDLLYLVAYRQITTGSATDILELVEDLPQCLPDPSRRLVAQYTQEFGLTAADHRLALAAFFIHHIGARFAYDPADQDAMHRIARVAAQLADRITNSGKEPV